MLSSLFLFQGDFELIYNNSRIFNGDENEFTIKAQRLMSAVWDQLNKYADHCTALESKIRYFLWLITVWPTYFYNLL